MVRKKTAAAIATQTSMEMRVVTLQLIIDQNSMNVEAFDITGGGPYLCHVSGAQAKALLDQLSLTLGAALNSATLNSIPLFVDEHRILPDQS